MSDVSGRVMDVTCPNHRKDTDEVTNSVEHSPLQNGGHWYREGVCCFVTEPKVQFSCSQEPVTRSYPGIFEFDPFSHPIFVGHTFMFYSQLVQFLQIWPYPFNVPC